MFSTREELVRVIGQLKNGEDIVTTNTSINEDSNSGDITTDNKVIIS